MRKNVIKIVIILLFFNSCATIDMDYINDKSNRVPTDELNLSMGYDIYHFRVDLLRNTRTTRTTSTNAQGATTTTTVTENVPYHYLGIRFGNGLFLDFNQNLSIDLIEFYNLDNSDFHISQKNKGFLAPKVEFHKTNANFSREVKSLFSSKTTAEIDEETILIENGIFKTRVTINLMDNMIEMIPEGVFGFLSEAKIIKNNDETITFPQFWKDSTFTQIDSNYIKMDDYLHVMNQEDELLIKYKGLFGLTTEYTFARTTNGFLFYDKNYFGVKVEKIGNKIIVIKNSKEIFTASIQ